MFETLNDHSQCIFAIHDSFSPHLGGVDVVAVTLS